MAKERKVLALVLMSEERMYEWALMPCLIIIKQVRMVLFLMSEIEIRRVVRNMFAHDINRTHDYSTDEKYPIEMLDIYRCGVT
jgi:hypothetical protein